MTTDEILCALDALAVQTGSLACLGCGHEHNCGIHGCAIIREAGKIIRWLSTDNTALRYAINPAKVKRSQEQNFNGAVAYMRALIEEQRAQIEKAEAENAVLREKQRWIPVTERLPDERDAVIILLKDGQVFRGEIRERIALPEWWYFYDASDTDMDMLGVMYPFFNDELWLHENPVVAWMPLPEATEEGDKADA